MINNLEKPIVSFDLETTGLDIRVDEIVEIGLSRINIDGSVNNLSFRVNPKIRISESAQNIHGISNEDLADCPVFSDVAGDIYDFMEGCTITGFNIVNFDLPIIVRQFAECGLDFETDDVLDTSEVCRKLNSRSLAGFCHRYGVIFEEEKAHGAVYDAAKTLELLAQVTSENSDSVGDSVEAFKTLVSGNNIDLAGKLITIDHEPCYSFGKFKDKAVRANPGYADWMLSQPTFTDDTKKHLKKILKM